MLSVKEQCYNIYMAAFNDDEAFTRLLFDNSFEDSCYYYFHEDKVVSMLFAFDVWLNGEKGKYVYGVATDEAFRGKGYMRKLFSLLEEKLENDYKFICLRPMSEDLFDFYARLNFEKKFFKSKTVMSTEKFECEYKKIETVKQFITVRKMLQRRNFVEYGPKFIELLMSYCEILTDSFENPCIFIVMEKESGKIKEVLGNKTHEKIYTSGNDFCYAVYKSIGYDFDGIGYLGLAMD